MPLAISLLDDINDLRASGFASGDVPEWNGSGWNSPARGSSPWTRTVIVDQGGKGDYTSIKDACDYVATQSPAIATRWRILVLSGQYTEIPFTVPQFTSLIGSLQPISVGVPTDVRLYVNAAYPDGNFITLSSNSIVHGLTAYSPFSGTPSSDRVMFYGAASCAVTGCFVQMLNSSQSYIYRHNHASGFTLAFNTFQANGATNVIVDVVLGGVTLANCNLAGIQTTLSAIFRNASSTTQTIYNCVITGSPVLDISTSAGTTTVYGTNIKKISGAGTVINYDGTVNTKWGTKQAYTATDIPLTVKGATSQSANLIDIRNSADTLLASVDKDGKADMAAYLVGGAAGASGTFTTADSKTVTVVNGIITSIV